MSDYWSNLRQMLMLKEKLNSFNERLYRIENHTDRSVRVLADIDRAKTRMEDCLKALEQVDKLSKLTADIEAVFATNDYRRVRESLWVHTDHWYSPQTPDCGKDRAHATLCFHFARRRRIPRLSCTAFTSPDPSGDHGSTLYRAGNCEPQRQYVTV